MIEPDIPFIRSQFPSLSGEWTYFDNAGGTQTVRQVGERIQDYLYQTNVQLGASYEISRLAGERVMEARKTWAEIINARASFRSHFWAIYHDAAAKSFAISGGNF